MLKLQNPGTQYIKNIAEKTNIDNQFQSARLRKVGRSEMKFPFIKSVF